MSQTNELFVQGVAALIALIFVVDIAYDLYTFIKKSASMRYESKLVNLQVFKIVISLLLLYIMYRYISIQLIYPATNMLVYFGIAVYFCAESRFRRELFINAKSLRRDRRGDDC